LIKQIQLINILKGEDAGSLLRNGKEESRRREKKV
jgi:hypothetical protein